MNPQSDPESGKSALFQSFIEPALWDKAKWRATMVISTPDELEYPILGICFEEIQSGIEIFKRWQERLGKIDEHDELRVTVIEGEIPGEPPGYTVFISSNMINTVNRMKKINPDFDPKAGIITARINRMNPAPNSPSLPILKKLYGKFYKFGLVPVHLRAAGPKVFSQYEIVKDALRFINATQINRNQPEFMVFSK